MTAQGSAMQVPAELGMGRDRGLQRLAALLAMFAVGEALGILAIAGMGDARFRMGLDLVPIGFLGNVILFPVVGALIVQRRPRTRVAWLMIGLGVSIGFGLVSYAYGVVGQPPARSLPLSLPLLVISQLFFVPAIGGATTWILLLYPTDHLLGPRWRWPGVLATVGALAFIVGSLLRPGYLDSADLPGLQNPLGIPGDVGALLGSVADFGNVLGLVGLVFGVASLVVRYRRASPVVAAQIRWLALTAIVAVAALGVSLAPLPGALDDFLFGAGLVLIAAMPVAIGIAITRYRLYDIDRLINRALVYGSLTAILAGVFTAAVGLAQRLFIAATGQTSDAAIVITTLIVATLYAPLRKRLEGVVDRWFKYEARQFGAYRAELLGFLALTDPRRAAARLAAETYRELQPIGVAVVDRHEGELATAGLWPQPIALRLPIGRGDRRLGMLLVGPRPDGHPYDARDVEGLADLAMLVGDAASE